ncbi:hypothetical protein R6V09_41355 [Streptomyces sp. W16]|uniref:hypothetical protein n=1 Tax=Streptomyces sp. W16 TaxID=3076631 RepID=UPI00295C0E84|nr:hypothetical protein [Streptomyces sp. W16]MDV9176562.1 hypothetical protein [Streptomyces sp. W16]
MTHVTHRTYRTHWIHGPLASHEEVNVVFFRGMSLDALTRELLSIRRIPLAYAKGGEDEDEGEWGLVMHDMFGWDEDDYDRPDYRQLCRDGGELAVFTTEPCIAKAHGPDFDYYRAGRYVCGISFENPSGGVGEQPGLLAPALTAARLIGPHAELDPYDNEERTVQAISAFFSLPDPDFFLT